MHSPTSSRSTSVAVSASLLAAFSLSSTAQAATEDYLANPRCATSAAGWTPSANATINRATEATAPGTACVVKPKASGTNTLTVRSALSPTTIARPGTKVHIASQVKATQAGKLLAVKLEEVRADGTVEQSFTGSRTSATTYGWVGAELTTKAYGTKIRVTYTATDLTGSNAFRFTNAGITVTPPPPLPVCALQNYADPAQGRLTFKDDFSGSAVDTTKWNVRNDTHLDFDDAYIWARNVTVHDGKLDIAGKRENTSKDRKWTTGYIDSIGKFAQKYGRWEIRAKIPTDTSMTRGVWPAFWLRSESIGEIDVMEAYGSPSDHDGFNPAGRYFWTVWKDTNDAEGPHVTGSFTPPTRPGAGYRTYAVQWSPECMVFSYDGQVTGVVDTTSESWLTESFEKPFNMRLNLQIGSSYWGRPTDAQTKPLFNYLVDSVKVYEKLPG